mgnify:FL=1
MFLVGYILLVVITHAEPPTFYAGLLKFHEQQLSQTEEVGKLAKPISILTLASLEYGGSFDLLTTRKMYNRRKQYFFEVNVTVGGAGGKPLRWNMEVHYLLIRQLANIEVISINITNSKPIGSIKPKYLDVKRSRCIIFPVGFSNSSMTERIVVYPNLDQEYLVYRMGSLPAESYTANWWLFVEAVIYDVENQRCGPMKLQDFKEDIDSMKPLDSTMRAPVSIDRDILVSNHYQYIPGVTQMHHYQIGKVSYLPLTHSLSFGKMGFDYSVLPVNTTCLYVDSTHSTVFIVFFFIFTGIAGVILFALIAYCIIKYFEKKKTTSSILDFQQMHLPPQTEKLEIAEPEKNLETGAAAPSEEHFVPAGSQLSNLKSVPSINLLPPSQDPVRN